MTTFFGIGPDPLDTNLGRSTGLCPTSGDDQQAPYDEGN